MAGGVFTSQNKIRPGAYITFKGVPRREQLLGNRGVVALAMALDWALEEGFTQIEVGDLLDGNVTSIIGENINTSNTPTTKVVRAVLENAHTLLLYNTRKGGVKANVTLEHNDIKVTAKYAGIAGNRISVQIKLIGDSSYEVITYLDDIRQHSQIVSSAADLRENKLVTFEATSEESGALKASEVTTLLTGGTNGTPTNNAYTDFLAKLQDIPFTTLAAFDDVNAAEDGHTIDGEIVYEFVRMMREDKGIKVQAVINDYNTANYEGLISTANQGIAYDVDTSDADNILTPEQFVAWVAGATAGADLTQSNTYKVVPNAVAILNPFSEESIEDGILRGMLVLSKRRDGAVVIERDINTLHTLGADKTDVFKQNKTIRLLDDINNRIATMFEVNYLGKVGVDEMGRTLFKSAVVGYLLDLQRNGAIVNFDSAEDIEVKEGEQPESFAVTIAIQPTYAVEKLYMTVNVK